jgi:hypothetical protein
MKCFLIRAHPRHPRLIQKFAAKSLHIFFIDCFSVISLSEDNTIGEVFLTKKDTRRPGREMRRDDG